MEAQSYSFEQIFQDHLSQVERLIARHTKDPDERMDLVQEVFIRAYSAFSQFRGEASVGTWLHRIAINVCSNAARSRERRHEEVLDDLDQFAGFESLQDVVDDLAHHERQVMLKQALRSLSAEQLIVLSLRYSDQLTLPEIAEVVGSPVDTVKSRLRSALDKIQSTAAFLSLPAARQSDEDADEPPASLDGLIVQGERGGKLYHNLGSMYLRKGLIEAALGEWSKAQQVAPTFLDSYLAAAQQYVETDRPRKAVETLEAAVSQIQSPALHTDLARLYLDLGDLEEGSQHSLRALDLDPRSPLAHYEAGRAYFKRAELQEAMRALRVNGSPPEDPVASDWRRSANHFEQAVLLRPDFFPAGSFLSQAYFRGGMPDRAEHTMSETVARAGDDEFVLHQAGHLHYKAGQLDLAERYLRRSISQKATADKLSLLGIIYLAEGRNEEAYVAFSEGLVHVRDKRPEAQLSANLAATAVILGKYDSAIRAAERALELDPEQIHARCNLSEAYLAQGINTLKVVKLCRDGLAKSPNHRCFHRHLAEACLRMGDYEEALEEATIAVELEPEIAQRWVLRARILLKLERAGEARADLEAAMKLDPEDSDAGGLLGGLIEAAEARVGESSKLH